MISEVRNTIAVLKVLERNVEDLIEQSSKYKSDTTALLASKDKEISELKEQVTKLQEQLDIINKEESEKGSS